MVQDFEVETERVSSVRYVSSLTYRFLSDPSTGWSVARHGLDTDDPSPPGRAHHHGESADLRPAAVDGGAGKLVSVPCCIAPTCAWRRTRQDRSGVQRRAGALMQACSTSCS
jgi:hypothetical protein